MIDKNSFMWYHPGEEVEEMNHEVLKQVILLFVLAATPLNAQTLACRNQESRLFGALTNAQMLDETGRIVPNENAAVSRGIGGE